MHTRWIPLAALAAGLAQTAVPDNPVWPRPTVIPAPAMVVGVRQAVVSLNGSWKVTTTPPAEFWSNSVDTSLWQVIQLPSHAVPQGVICRRQGEYVFKRKIAIPADFASKRILLQFDGVTGQGRAWIDGVFLREHFGGFTTWNCDITDRVSPGKEAWLTVAATDETEGLSGYNNGGILRSVRLIAEPQDYLTRFNVEADLDREYRNGVLRVWVAMSFNQASAARIRLALKDRQGKASALTPSSVDVTRDDPEKTVEIPVAAPIKWDAEHPNLYTLEAAVSNGAASATVVRKVGFRKVEVAGRKLLVNGKEVKLRGVCRKDIYPLTGRSVPLEVLDQDILIFRAANINYIRTSHYPTNPEFLDAADGYGMYIESENSVSMARGAVASNPAITPHYLSQLADMIERDRSHPSVIIWSLGNESNWGSNVLKEAQYARAEDPARPLMFSWSHLTPPELQKQVYDIYSFHYPSYRRGMADGGPAPGGDLEKNREWGGETSTMPVLHDEYAHVPTYITEDLRRDPNVNNFWGHSIRMLWEKIFSTEGALGGAIWGSVDNSSVAPEDRFVVSRNDWGIIDGWRREKPEYWLVKKAYSPVRIDDRPVSNPGSGRPLVLTVKNWFDHTNLDETSFQWTVGQESGRLDGPNVEPHSEGLLRLPARRWKDGEVVNLKAFRMGDLLVDEYNLPINPPPPPTLPAPRGPAPAIEERSESITVKGTGFVVAFSRRNGLITEGSYGGTKIIESGPYLNLVGQRLGKWSLESIRVAREDSEAVVHIAGSYGPAKVRFEVHIDDLGLIATRYTLGQLPPLARAWLTRATGAM